MHILLPLCDKKKIYFERKIPEDIVLIDHTAQVWRDKVSMWDRKGVSEGVSLRDAPRPLEADTLVNCLIFFFCLKDSRAKSMHGLNVV